MLLNIAEDIANLFRDSRSGYDLTGSIIVGVVIALLVLVMGLANKKTSLPPKSPPRKPTDRTQDIINNWGKDERGSIITPPPIKRASAEKNQKKISN